MRDSFFHGTNGSSYPTVRMIHKDLRSINHFYADDISSLSSFDLNVPLNDTSWPAFAVHIDCCLLTRTLALDQHAEKTAYQAGWLEKDILLDESTTMVTQTMGSHPL